MAPRVPSKEGGGVVAAILSRRPRPHHRRRTHRMIALEDLPPAALVGRRVLRRLGGAWRPGFVRELLADSGRFMVALDPGHVAHPFSLVIDAGSGGSMMCARSFPHVAQGMC